MMTLRELGPDGFRLELEHENNEELQAYGQRPPSPSMMGFGPEVGSHQFAGRTARKTDAQNRLLIDQEQHSNLIREEIWDKLKTPEGRTNVATHVRVTRNILKRTADRLAVAYETSPVRSFPTTALDKKMRELMGHDEGNLNIEAEQWARYAFLMNVVHVIPQVIDGRMHFETILPHSADALRDGGEHDPSILTYLARGDGFSRVAVDSERYWYLDTSGAIVEEIEHGYLDLQGRPMVPWIPWRVRGWTKSQDYWQRGVGRQLVDATLKVGRVAAQMDYVRTTNNGKLSSLTAKNLDDAIPAEQKVSPERPLLLRNGEFEVHDLTVPVTEFLADIDAEAADVADAYGVPAHVISSKSDRSRIDPEAQAAIKKIRGGMIKYLVRAEIQTHVKAAIIARAEGHRIRVNPRAVAKMGVQFPPLTYVDSPKERMEAALLEMSAGQLDHVDLAMQMNPGLDEESAEAKVNKTIGRRNQYAAKLSERNLPADAGQDGDNLAQLQGRLGGMNKPTSNPDRNEDGRTDEQRSAAG